MPELPEVETIKRQLNDAVRGQTIEAIKVLRDKSFVGTAKQVVGRKILGFDRKAKFLLVELDGKPKLILAIHLKMTGQLIYVPASGGKRVAGGHPTADWVKKLPSSHTRVILSLTQGTLYFNDMRVFGWIKVLSSDQLKLLKAKLPPDVVDKDFTVRYLRQILLGSRRPVKLIIMDQAKLGGVGNIYANDGLYYARINPITASATIANDDEQVNKLFIGLKRVIGQGIQYNGASDSNYVHISGMGGKYQEHFLVYKKQGKKCRRCGHLIKKIKLGGRGTYFCPHCQA